MDGEPELADPLDQLEGAIVACFLLPLPEPLPLPTGVPIVTVRVEPNHSLLTRLASGAASPGEAARLERHVSLVVHQRTVTQAHANITDELIQLTNDALPWATVSPAGSASPIRSPRRRSPGRRSRGARRRRRGEDRQGDATIVEAVVYLPNVSSEDALSDAFDEALVAIRDLQEAYYQIRQRPLSLVRRETMPVLVPYAIGRLRRGEPPERVDGIGLFATNTNMAASTCDEEMGPAELDRLGILRRSPPHAFSDYLSLQREAQLASRARGDHRAAAVMSGAASETFLDTLLLHLLWEQCTKPADAAAIFVDPRRGLLARARRDLAGLIGGIWDENRPGPFRDWHDACYQLRHRAVHAAYFPSALEVHQAIASLQGLVAAAGVQLRGHRIGQFPRTTILTSGETKLTEAGLWQGKLKRVALDPNEPKWGEMFRNWSSAVDLHRRLQTGPTPTPESSRSHLLLIPDSSGGHRWVLHDHDTGMACIATRPSEADVEPLASSLRILTEDRRLNGISGRSILMTGGDYTSVPAGQWVPADELVPEAAVMLDRSDAGLR